MLKKFRSKSTNENINNEKNSFCDSKLSKTEQETILKFFECLFHNCSDFDKYIDSEEQELLPVALINIAITTGCIFELLRQHILLEFEKNCKNEQGSIMRGNCMASKLLKEYLSKIGKKYLQEMLSDLLNQIADSGKSMEIDSFKVDKPSELENNKNYLLDRVKAIIQKITSQEMITKMPTEIKVIANYLGEFSNIYVPEQFYALVGGFILLRYINPAVSNPEGYGIINENKITPMIRRNFILISKILQSLSNGVEFGSKESYMVSVNDFIRINIWQMEQYFQKIVSQSPNPPKIIDPNAVTEADFMLIHNILIKNSDSILEEIKQVIQKKPSYHQIFLQLSEYLDKLKQYRNIENFLQRKYSLDQSVSLKVKIETEDQSFEQTWETTANFLQSQLQRFISKLNKQNLKISKKNKEQLKKIDSTIFGKTLYQLMNEVQIKQPDLKIPPFIQEAINCILLKGLGENEIFQLTTDNHKIETLKQEIDKGESIKLIDMENIHIICNLIKHYLKDLPETLLTEQLYQNFISLGSKSSFNTEDREVLKRYIKSLPKYNYDLLNALARLWWMIDLNSIVNCMSAQLLAMTPSFLLNKNLTGEESLKETNCLINIITRTIKDYEFLFEESIILEENSTQIPLLKHKLVGHIKAILYIIQVTENIIATISSSSIILWDSEKWVRIKMIEPPNSTFILNAISIDGEIWYSTEKYIIIQKYTGELIKIIEQGSPSLSYLHGCVWTCLLNANKINIYNIKTKELINSFGITESLFIMKTVENVIWGGSISGNLFVFKQDGSFIQLPSPHQKKVNAITFSNEHVWAGSDEGIISIWKKDSYELVKKMETHSFKIKSMTYFQNEVWCGTWDMSIKIYSSKNFSLLYVIKEQHLDAISGILFHYNKTKKKWFSWVSSYDTTISILFLPKQEQIINFMDKFEENNWFFLLSKEESEILLSSCENDSFLIKPNSSIPNSYILSIYKHKQKTFIHKNISPIEDDFHNHKGFIVESNLQKIYNSLLEIVQNNPDLIDISPIGYLKKLSNS